MQVKEVVMAVKVLITRHFKKSNTWEIFALINKSRSDAMNQKGYITGESLVSHDNPQKILVISTWQSVKDWENWKANPLRKTNEERLAPYLERPTDYEIYDVGTHPGRR
jgi:heme-degrading monooxygenase HmoA